MTNESSKFPLAFNGTKSMQSCMCQHLIHSCRERERETPSLSQRIHEELPYARFWVKSQGCHHSLPLMLEKNTKKEGVALGVFSPTFVDDG